MFFILLIFAPFFFQELAHGYNFDASGRLTIAAEERSRLQHEKIILQMKADYGHLIDDWECGLKQHSAKDHSGWLTFIPATLLIKMALQLWQEELSLEDMGIFLMTEGAMWAAKRFQELPLDQLQKKDICQDRGVCKKVLNDFKIRLIESKLQLASVGLPLSSEEKNLLAGLEDVASDFDAKIKACDVLNAIEKP